MPIRTPYFGLEAFIVGDVYSGVIDQSRFTSIDNYMAFISEIIGPGIIQGWNLESSSPLKVKVTSGWGIIDRKIIRTFGDYEKTLSSNNFFYVWMRSRTNSLGQISAFSNVASTDYIDLTKPFAPQQISLVSQTADSLSFSWSSAVDIDIEKYIIYRSKNNFDYTYIGETKNLNYIDNNLQENQIYYYKIKSQDLSGNISDFSNVFLAITLKDLSKPAPPTSVSVINSNKSAYIYWNAPAYGNISKLLFTITPINEDRVQIGQAFQQEASPSLDSYTMTGLINEQRYSVSMKSVSKYGVESEEVVFTVFPKDIDVGPSIKSINLVDSKLEANLLTNNIYVSWDLDIDPYESFNGSIEIRVEEYRIDGTSITSEWISVPFNEFSTNINVFSYLVNGEILYKSIDPRTIYYFSLRSVREDGTTGAIKRIKHFTPSFVLPDPPQNLKVDFVNSENSILYTWSNSFSKFENNFITIKKYNSQNEESILVLNQDINKTTYYSVASNNLESDSIYRMFIYCVDEFGNKSETVSIEYQTPNFNELRPPAAPRDIIASSGDGQIILSWAAPIGVVAKSYKVYRAEDAASFNPNDFTFVEEVSSDNLSYIDYEVQNKKTYVYLVTTVDAYGKESLNPINDRYINYKLTTATPSSYSTLNSPSNLKINIINRSIQIYWEQESGQFDGYQIFRSIKNKYSFQLIATVGRGVVSYLDSNVLKQTGKVYYIVRKFKNEADLFFTESDASVSNAILLGTVSTKNGQTIIDSSKRRNIKNIEDPVREETKKRIEVHTHSWVNEFNDKRINLSSDLIIDDWLTSDYLVYTTESEIPASGDYSVYLNNQEASEFGVLYSINRENKTLVFSQPLASSGFDRQADVAYVFDSEPAVKVLFRNVEEVQDILPEQRVESLSAQQVTSGQVKKDQLPKFHHSGRIKESLIPLQETLSPVDGGYSYILNDTKQNIGDAIVFYDVVQVLDSNLLLSSTSDGIYTSPDFGVSWNKRFELTTPASQIFYSSKFKTHLALTNRGVFYSNAVLENQFGEWFELPGAETTKVVRSIIEDKDGDVFIGSNLGVYKLEKNFGQGTFFFKQTPIVDFASTEIYGMLYDKSRSRIIVSNETGIFESKNKGLNWSFSDEFAGEQSIYSFAQKDGYIYAITDFMLWRRRPNDYRFERVGVFEEANTSRKIIIWKNRIYVSTDYGLLVSDLNADIYQDYIIKFVEAFPQLRKNKYLLPACSLNNIDNKLFVGSENILFLSTATGKIDIHSEFSDQVIPTIYINGKPQSIGYRFSTSSDLRRKVVCFDVKQKISSTITIANQYKKFVCKNKGWADTNYLSSVVLYINDNKVNDISVAEKPAQEFSSLTLPFYNDRNAFKIGADLQKEKLNASLVKMLEVERNSDGQVIKLKGFTKDNVNITLFEIEKFLSQIYKNSRNIITINDDGTETSNPFSVPAFRVLLLSNNPSYYQDLSIGVYKDWVGVASNTNKSFVGKFGSELDSDGNLPKELIGGVGDVGVLGG